MKFIFSIVVIAIAIIICTCDVINSADEEAKLLADPNEFIKLAKIKVIEAFKNCSEITDEPAKYYKVDEGIPKETLKMLKECSMNLQTISKTAITFDLSKIENIETRETVRRFGNLDDSLKISDENREFGESLTQLMAAYIAETIPDYDDDEISYSVKQIQEGEIMTSSQDAAEMNYYWTQIRNTITEQAYSYFFGTMLAIKVKAEEYNISTVEYWYPNYSEQLMADFEHVMEQMKPFYLQMHAYLRHKLFTRYGAGVIKPQGPIPLTFLRQAIDKYWSVLSPINDDFSLSNLPNYERDFVEQEIDAEKSLEIAEQFYKSLGFDAIPKDYWKYNMSVINADEENACRTHFKCLRSQRCNFYYCHKTDFLTLVEDHVYVGKIHAALLTQELPFYFYDSGIMGDVIGNAVKLSAQTPKHMAAIGLGDKDSMTDEIMENINARLAVSVMLQILHKYVAMRIITDYMAEKIEPQDFNEHFWKLLEEYAGAEPPVDRNEDAIDIPYLLLIDVVSHKNLLNTFQAPLWSFTTYKAACQKSGYSGTLCNCDFYNSTDVGDAFKQMLSMAGSRPFKQTAAPLFNYERLSAEALLNYFEPARSWMTRYVIEHNLTTGWDETTKEFTESIVLTEKDANAFINKSSEQIYSFYEQMAKDLFEQKDRADEYDYGNNFWKISSTAIAAERIKKISIIAKRFDTNQVAQKDVKRAVQKLAQIANVYVLGEELQGYMTNKANIYNTSLDKDILIYKNTNIEEPVTVAYNPDILNIFQNSSDAAELRYYWEAWRDRNGAFAKNLLLENLETFEKAANILETSLTEFWFKHYSDDFVEKMEKVIKYLKPFYKEIHYYVRQQLMLKYGDEDFSTASGAIPDHFVQQVLAQIWTNRSIVETDFAFNKLPPVERAVKEQNYDGLKLLKIADEFYQSLGFTPLGEEFWQQRVRSQEDSLNDTNCYAKIYDQIPKAYLKYCETVNYRKLLQNFGYMARIYYAAEKKNLPAYYFDSYDFEYPVGEAVILSAGNYKHAQSLGLFADFQITDEVLINRLMRMAIHTLFNLHKHFVHTKLIADYLEGDIAKHELTKYYWKYMIEYAGIEPPSDRRADNYDFPFEFYADLEDNHQVKKFVSEVLGYRIYERLCKLSDHKGDLHKCNFFGSTVAGDALREMMQLGSSKPRNTVFKHLVMDTHGLNGAALRNYYAPIEEWLKKRNENYDNEFAESKRQFLPAESFYE